MIDQELELLSHAPAYDGAKSLERGKSLRGLRVT